MSRTLRSIPPVMTAVIGLALVAAAVQPAQAAPPSSDPVTVATGLNNPRQLTVGPGQRIYVAEAGVADECSPLPGVGLEFQVCGLTGSVTEIRGTDQRRVVTDIPALNFNGEVVGASDVDVRGNEIAVLIGGLAGAATARDSLPAQYASFGTLRTGSLKSGPVAAADLAPAADLNAYEVANNPDGNVPADSNAVGFTTLNARNWAVTDAGGNYLATVGARGENTVAVFPNGPAVPNPFPFPPPFINPQAVPTDVVVGPDGAFYVSQLTGFPFPTGGSTIWRVTTDGQVSAYATGLTMVTSLAWKGGTLYAVQLDDGNFFDGHVGSLRKVTPGGSTHEAVVANLDAPYGVAIRGNSAFLTTGSVSAGGGAVIQVDLR
ncbi:ScyD/ScyE family protein [Agromyces sp. Marseille-P2726]|uniref:ScyD/ScyE family protein n=1 Tax=Agromyces sp. Marseille-P2726 TaxID=2709132 RepID=UPI00156F22D5|nr:ScyD/ScyE family protein [Agromyces sp. Marseille-P2726]